MPPRVETPPHLAPWHQRWLKRSHSWVDDRSFDRFRYEVAPISEQQARAFVAEHHYQPYMPPEIASWGLFDLFAADELLVGALTLNNPMNVSVLTTPFPSLVPYQESAVLSRLVQLPSVPPPGESFFTAEALRQAERMGFRGIVTQADPVPRFTVDGRCVKPGHFGTIYQAGNAIPAGRTRKRLLWLLPDKTVLSERSGQKVGRERNADIAVRQLLAAGARPMCDREDPQAWFTGWRKRLCSRMPHTGNWRYLFVRGNRREQRALRAEIPLAAMLGVAAIDRPLHGYYPKADECLP